MIDITKWFAYLGGWWWMKNSYFNYIYIPANANCPSQFTTFISSLLLPNKFRTVPCLFPGSWIKVFEVVADNLCPQCGWDTEINVHGTISVTLLKYMTLDLSATLTFESSYIYSCRLRVRIYRRLSSAVTWSIWHIALLRMCVTIVK